MTLICNHRTPYRTVEINNLFEEHVLVESSHVIPSNSVNHLLNRIRNLNHPFSSSHSTDDKISDSIDIEDNYLTIDNAFNTRFVTDRKECDRAKTKFEQRDELKKTLSECPRQDWPDPGHKVPKQKLSKHKDQEILNPVCLKTKFVIKYDTLKTERDIYKFNLYIDH